MPGTIHNLILDWSGTLVDDLQATLAATNAVFKHYGKDPFTPQSFQEHFRLPYDGFYAEHLPEVPLEELEVLFKEAFLKAEHLVAPLPNTRHFLAAAQQKGLRLFILSSMNEEALLRQAESFGMTSAFESIDASVIDKRERIIEILSRHQLDPTTTAYVGDMVHDIHAARAGQLTAVALLSGYDPAARLAAADPDLILPHIGNLPDFCGHAPQSIRTDISLKKLQFKTHIGVPPEEREKPQTLKLSLALELKNGIAGLQDDLAQSVDYFALSEHLRQEALRTSRQLIETLAEDFVDLILANYPVAAVTVEIEKAILINCEAVSVTLSKRC